MSTFYTPRVFLTHSIDMAYCAIDFGTSNSAVAVPDGNRIALASVEKGATTLPTAIFFTMTNWFTYLDAPRWRPTSTASTAA
jgi:hypothetical chaperone protein